MPRIEEIVKNLKLCLSMRLLLLLSLLLLLLLFCGTVVEQGELGDSLKRTATVTIEANDDPYGYFVIINLQRPVRIDEEARGRTFIISAVSGQFLCVFNSLTPSRLLPLTTVPHKGICTGYD